MAKINLVIKNINAVNVSTNSLQIQMSQGLVEAPLNKGIESILLVLVVINQHFFITTTIFILIIVALIRNVIIQCLFQNQLLFQLHQCLNYLVKLILNVCVILCMLF